jgi:hypothetical protein
MWHDIAEAIEPYCVNGAGYIRDYFEDENCTGFSMINFNRGELGIRAQTVDREAHVYPIEEDLRIFYKDKPGTFEGLPLDGNRE